MSTNKNIENVDAVTVSSTVLGNVLGLTKRRVEQLAKENILVKVAKGKYSLSESIKNYITYIKTNKDIKEVNYSEDYEKERALHERVKREQREIQLAKTKGEMHHSDEVKQVMNDMLIRFKSKLLNLPAKLAPILVARDEITYIQGQLEREVHEALEELSEYDPKDFYKEDFDLDDDDIGEVNG